jgi:hypothetical protein
MLHIRIFAYEVITMKQPKDVTDLARTLTATMTTPPLTIAKAPPAEAASIAAEPATNKRTRAAKKLGATSKGSVSVFLRVPAARFEELEQEAIARTKATGKGVTVQQVILAKLDGRKP